MADDSGLQTQQIDVFSPEQKELFANLMGYLNGGGMFPGGNYQFRSPRIVNNAFSSFPEGNPWRGVSQTGQIPPMSTAPSMTDLQRLAQYRQAAIARNMGQWSPPTSPWTSQPIRPGVAMPTADEIAPGVPKSIVPAGVPPTALPNPYRQWAPD